MNRRSAYRKLVCASLLVGGLAASGAPALAASSSSGTVPITFGTTAGCSTCRTLVLLQSDGKTPLTGLDLSPGTNGFIANVVDSGINPAVLGNFSVASTMSNLYQYDSKAGTYNCNVFIPSSDVSLNSAPALLNASSLSSAVQPVFTIAGNVSGVLTSVLTSTLGGIAVNTNPTITGVQSLTDSALTQAAEAGNSAVPILAGTLLNGLPVSLSSGSGGPFSAPAAPPSGSTCSGNGSGATSVPVLNGALTTSPLLTDLQNAVGSLTLTQMITAGYLDAQTAENLVATATNVPLADLNSTLPPWAGVLTSLENTLTGTIASLVPTATSISGTYGADPVMGVAAPGATPASYQGVLTVTLTSS